MVLLTVHHIENNMLDRLDLWSTTKKKKNIVLLVEREIVFNFLIRIFLLEIYR